MERRIIFRRKNGRVIPIATTIGAGVGTASSINYVKKTKVDKRALVKLRKKYLHGFAMQEGMKMNKALKSTNVVYTDAALRKKGVEVVKMGKANFSKAVKKAQALKAIPAILAGAAIGGAIYGGAAMGIQAINRRFGGR